MRQFRLTLLLIPALGLLLLFIAAFWQVLGEPLRLFGVRADGLPFAVGMLAVCLGPVSGGICGLFAGLLADAAASTGGFFTLFYFLLALLLGLWGRAVGRPGWLLTLSSGFLVYFLPQTLRLSFLVLFREGYSFSLLLTKFLPGGLWSLVWSLPLLFLTRKLSALTVTAEKK